MNHNQIINSILKRSSIRQYKKEEISDGLINTILDTGRYAPSGLNNQPWRFSIIKNEKLKTEIAELTKYKRIVLECNTCIAVFYNIPAGYNRDKDLMSIGACIENMLLAAHALGIGGVWLGEILNKKEEVSRLLQVNEENELAAVIALGYPEKSETRKSRIDLESLILNSYY